MTVTFLLPVVELECFWQQRMSILRSENLYFEGYLCPCAQLLRGKVFGRLTTLFPCAPTGEVHMPSGKTATPEIVDNKDGTVTVRYAPTEVGLHEMHIKYMGSHIPGESGSAPWPAGPAEPQDLEA